MNQQDDRWKLIKIVGIGVVALWLMAGITAYFFPNDAPSRPERTRPTVSVASYRAQIDAADTRVTSCVKMPAFPSRPRMCCGPMNEYQRLIDSASRAYPGTTFMNSSARSTMRDTMRIFGC